MCFTSLYIISCYLLHFIWYVISVKHVFIIRFHRFLLCISITINVCISFRCVFYMVVNFSFVYRSRALTLFPVFEIHFIEIKQIEWKNPIGTFTVYYIMIVSLSILRFNAHCHPNKMTKKNTAKEKKKIQWWWNKRIAVHSVQCAMPGFNGTVRGDRLSVT